MRRTLMVCAVVIGSALIAAGCGQFGSTYKGSSTSKTTQGGTGQKVSKKPFDAAAIKAAGCTPLEELKSFGRQHTQDPKEKVPYTENPPASGKHYAVPLDWGVYSKDEPDEHWIHNLEHGHVVVLYKGITPAEKSKLLKNVKRDPYHVVVLPRAKNSKDGIYYMGWTKKMFCAKASAEALQYAIDKMRDQGPELFTNDPSMGGKGK